MKRSIFPTVDGEKLPSVTLGDLEFYNVIDEHGIVSCYLAHGEIMQHGGGAIVMTRAAWDELVKAAS